MVKKPPANAGDVRDVDSIPESERSPEKWHGNPFQYSCLENSKDSGAWQATVHTIKKSWTRLKRLNMHRDNRYPTLSLLLLGTACQNSCCLLLLLLSRFSRVRLCATPQTAAHQALPSLGFSREEHWSGLPFQQHFGHFFF